MDEVEDSEDDWTFNDYRQSEVNKEESVTNTDVGDTSSGIDVSNMFSLCPLGLHYLIYLFHSHVQLEPEGKADETCIQTNCQANDLGNQLEKLTVDEVPPEITIPLSEPEQVEVKAEDLHKDEIVEPDVVHQPQIEEIASQTKEVQPHIQQV